MNSVLDILFSQVNITLTSLMIFLILYWLVTMFTGLDFDTDFDVDIDIDADIDIEVDSNIEGGNVDFQDVANTEVNKEDIAKDRRKPLKWWQVLLVYFNFVGLPFMFTFTCWIFFWWITTLIVTSVTVSYENTFGFIIMIAAIIPGLVLTKIFTTPFKNFFKNLNKDGDLPLDVVGRRGVCLSTLKEDKMGSAEVVIDGTPLSIYAKSLNGEQINYKEDILIIKQSKNKNYYYVKSYTTN